MSFAWVSPVATCVFPRNAPWNGQSRCITAAIKRPRCGATQKTTYALPLVRAAQNGCCRGRRIEAKKEIQVAIINSCVRFLPGARPPLFLDEEETIVHFLRSPFSSLAISLATFDTSVSSFGLSPAFPTLRSYFRPLVCVRLRRAAHRGSRAQWSISLLPRASAGAWTLRKFHPLRAVCEEIFSRLCDRALPLNSG